MIRQAEADLKKADANVDVTRADLERAQAAHVAARQQQSNMRATLEWLNHQAEQPKTVESVKSAEIIVEEHRVRPSAVVAVEHRVRPSAVAERFGRPVPSVKQSDLCLMALEHLGRLSTTTEIREYLQSEGYTFDQDQVRSSLKYLGRKKPALVESPRTGMWRLTRPTPTEQVEPEVALNGSGTIT
jgi:hypothetical protein